MHHCRRTSLAYHLWKVNAPGNAIVIGTVASQNVCREGRQKRSKMWYRSEDHGLSGSELLPVLCIAHSSWGLNVPRRTDTCIRKGYSCIVVRRGWIHAWIWTTQWLWGPVPRIRTATLWPYQSSFCGCSICRSSRWWCCQACTLHGNTKPPTRLFWSAHTNCWSRSSLSGAGWNCRSCQCKPRCKAGTGTWIMRSS